jgi:hypothetical protein
VATNAISLKGKKSKKYEIGNEPEGRLNMSDEFRYRVLIIDPRIKNFVAAGNDGGDISGKATASEIVKRLEADLGSDAFNPARTLEWLEAQDPADAGDAAVLQLNAGRELEIVVKSV